MNQIINNQFPSFEVFKQKVIEQNIILNDYSKADFNDLIFKQIYSRVIQYYGFYYWANYTKTDLTNQIVFSDELASIVPPFFQHFLEKAKPDYNSINPTTYSAEQPTKANSLTLDPSTYRSAIKVKARLKDEMEDYGFRRDFTKDIMEAIDSLFVNDIPPEYKDDVLYSLETSYILDNSTQPNQGLNTSLEDIRVDKLSQEVVIDDDTSTFGRTNIGTPFVQKTNLEGDGNVIHVFTSDATISSIKNNQLEVFNPISQSSITNKKYVDSENNTQDNKIMELNLKLMQTQANLLAIQKELLALNKIGNWDVNSTILDPLETEILAFVENVNNYTDFTLSADGTQFQTGYDLQDQLLTLVLETNTISMYEKEIEIMFIDTNNGSTLKSIVTKIDHQGKAVVMFKTSPKVIHTYEIQIKNLQSDTNLNIVNGSLTIEGQQYLSTQLFNSSLIIDDSSLEPDAGINPKLLRNPYMLNEVKMFMMDKGRSFTDIYGNIWDIIENYIHGTFLIGASGIIGTGTLGSVQRHGHQWSDGFKWSNIQGNGGQSSIRQFKTYDISGVAAYIDSPQGDTEWDRLSPAYTTKTGDDSQNRPSGIYVAAYQLTAFGKVGILKNENKSS